jgi:hypothetical protein
MAMDERERSRRMHGTLTQCVMALGVIFVAFWISDVAPGQPSHSLLDEEPWIAPVRAIDEALVRHGVAAAERAWREAYGQAQASRRWEAFIAVGDASLRIGEVAQQRPAAEARARAAYLAALFRARQQQTVEGVLRTAQAFADLGDREVVERCLEVARALAQQTGDAEAEARVRAISSGLTAR